MSGLFTPADGEQARWRKVYDLLLKRSVGDTITYVELEEMFPGLDRQSIRAVVRRAAKEYLEERMRALSSVRGVGYRIVDPGEHVQLARVHQARSTRSLVRAHNVVTQVDYTGMSPEVRALTDATARALTLQMQYNKQLDVRQRKLESALSTVSNRTAVVEDDVAELKKRLAALETKDSGDE